MRGKYIIVGGIFTIIGIFLLFYGGTLTTADGAIVTYQIGQITQISGGILLIIGMCFILIGGIFPDKKIKLKPPSIYHNEGQINFKIKDDKEGTIKDQYQQLKKDSEK